MRLVERVVWKKHFD